jgi:hypothetical protein
MLTMFRLYFWLTRITFSLVVTHPRTQAINGSLSINGVTGDDGGIAERRPRSTPLSMIKNLKKGMARKRRSSSAVRVAKRPPSAHVVLMDRFMPRAGFGPIIMCLTLFSTFFSGCVARLYPHSSLTAFVSYVFLLSAHITRSLCSIFFFLLSAAFSDSHFMFLSHFIINPSL